MKKKKKIKKIFPKLKKDFKNFCLKEEGRVDKSDLAKMGLTLAMLTTVFEQQASAAHNNQPGSVHENYFTEEGGAGGHHSGLSAHGSHNSHGSHGSHGQW